jgi:hypothetical protein
MRKSLLLFIFAVLCKGACLHALTVSLEDANRIGDKIWINEGAGSVEFLTHWNVGENFASLGIGHFIWYPEGKKEKFQEMFPEMLRFLKEKKASLPDWLVSIPSCPWNTREEFYKDINTPRMQTLRQFLFKTKDLQALFMADRLEKTLPLIIENCPVNQRDKVKKTFYRLAETPNGLYALIDYLNFKGAGIATSEQYNGQGWGLTQVLLKIPSDSKNPVADFANAAKELLAQRVKNSPPERNEKKWLEGWFNRLDTYNSEGL